MCSGALAGIVHTSATPRNVLYIVYDDLRPDLSPYDVSFMDNQTPNIQRLADTGTLFERAYVQIAVCSPSRNSFSTGRRPNSTKVWNFINHFRNADCPTQNEMKISGTTMPGGFRGENPVQPKWTQTNTGGHAQCCTLCVVGDGCAGWTYNRGNCTLFSAIESYAACPSGQPAESSATCVSGTKGEFPQWTPLPGALGTLRDQRAARRAHARPPRPPALTHFSLPCRRLLAHFRNNGYMVLGSGKYYHPGGHSGVEGSSTHPAGAGTPPMADRNLSWTAAGPGGLIQFPNQTVYCEKWGTYNGHTCGSPYGNFQYLNPDDGCAKIDGDGGYSDYCNPVGFAEDGTPPSPPVKGQQAMGDFVTYQDAIIKLKFAARNLKEKGQPFFQVMGIKRPHLSWRSPPAYASKFPIEDVAAPTQLTMDRSIDPVAYTVFPMDAANCTSPFAGSAHGGACKNFVKDPSSHGSDM